MKPGRRTAPLQHRAARSNPIEGARGNHDLQRQACRLGELPSGEWALVVTGTVSNRGHPTDVGLACPSKKAALRGAHRLAAKMGVSVIYIRGRD
jgi:hypothetical protein